MVDGATISQAVYDAVRTIAVELRPDVLAALERAVSVERSERARRVLAQLVENAGCAVADTVPLCQDTGTVWVWIELGAEEAPLADLQPIVDDAVARAYRDGSLRMSVVADALVDRTNTGDNTPAFVDLTVRPGSGATVHVMLKGGGSDNASALEMLPPGAGADGVLDFVVRRVREKAAGACPPLVLGIGVGSTFDTVAKLAKKALLRPVGDPNPDDRIAAFERRVLDAVNGSGIGPAGLGGDTTALGVSVLTAPCHIAALPVAVNMGCSAVRSVSVHVG